MFEDMTHIGLNYVFDTGHAHMGDGVEANFNLMKDKIRSTHVHDNDGHSDSHLVPLVSNGGTIDWKSAMQLLRSRENCPLLLELKEPPGMAHPLDAPANRHVRGAPAEAVMLEVKQRDLASLVHAHVAAVRVVQDGAVIAAGKRDRQVPRAA